MNKSEHPCADIPCLPWYAKFYELFRWLVAALLLLALLLMWNRGCAKRPIVEKPTDSVTVAQPATVDNSEAGEADSGANADVAPAVITTAALAGAAKLGDILLGQNRASAPIDISGTGEPGATVELFANGEPLGKAVIDADGHWQYSGDLEMKAGQTDITARMILLNGKVENATLHRLILPESAVQVASDSDAGGTTDSASAETDNAAVAAITIDSITDGVMAGDDVEICGSAEPNATVDIVVNGEVVGETSADGSGKWCYTGGFPAGDYSIEARDITNGDSQPRSVAAAQPMTIVAAVATEPTADSGDSEEATFDVVEVANVDDPPTVGTVGFGMSGTGRPGMLVEVVEHGVVVGGARALDDGTWSCTCTLPPGEHVLIARDADDPENSSKEVTFVVENFTEVPTPPTVSEGGDENYSCVGKAPTPGEIVGTVYFVGECEWMEIIAERLGTTVAEIMTFNPQLTSPTLIYPGQALNIPSAASCLDNNNG
ncbi:MAG TPA: LysM peptidoglycan-binding domain-containing protein [Anaerolineae bacterium]|nr:LysM peptidoglycan-binding domain-containing protein [Anaerolineae bacterium]